jgi:SulP family sulfate permease
VSIIHALALLVSALFLGAIIARIPLAALAGVLMVTAWRMNEWHLIRFYLSRRLKSPSIVMVATMIATVALDLTQAIIVGVVVQLLFFINQVARLSVVPTDVDWDRLRDSGIEVGAALPGIKVVYVSGPLFFGAASQLGDALDDLGACRALILSMRGVPVVDVSGLHTLEQIWQNQVKDGGLLYLTGLQPQVRDLLERGGLLDEMGRDKFHWGADAAITAAHARLTAAAAACEWVPGRQRHFGDAGPDELPLGVVGVQ